MYKIRDEQLQLRNDGLYMAFNVSPPGAVIYASVNWVSIGWDNGLSPIRHQAII